MIKGGILSSVAWFVCFALSSATCSSSENGFVSNETDESEFYGSTLQPEFFSNIDSIDVPIVHIKGEEPYPDEDHAYLNTVDWQLRQPLDLSVSKVVTKAKSVANRIEVRYFCGDLALGDNPEEHQPTDGEIEFSVDTECETKFSAHLLAFGDDATVEYIYTIDIGLLNSLGI
ncbi:MAG: hypothetical protein JJU46_01605 [Balneolaceae bacterium]|nr:hypothetical protein [Balneolaceae bacterium]MCH8549057.1 hypothetical protein [Balneolaceae bacterium]